MNNEVWSSVHCAVCSPVAVFVGAKVLHALATQSCCHPGKLWPRHSGRAGCGDSGCKDVSFLNVQSRLKAHKVSNSKLLNTLSTFERAQEFLP